MQIIYTDRHKLHDIENVVINGAPFGSEDVSARAEHILRAVQAAQLGPIESPTDHGLEPLLAIHDADYVEFLRTAYADYVSHYQKAEPVLPGTFAPRGIRRKTKHIYGRLGYYAYGSGSPILEHTWEAAYWSAQCALTAADCVLAGDRAAYALCRPPGHHATANLYGGLCYLNNAAIAARYLQTSSPLPCEAKEGSGVRVRVTILDIDYHHGNGTQEIFYTDPTVLYCSLHAHPDDDYPFYWGESNETGEGPGAGYNRNWPLLQGAGDDIYLATLDEALAVIFEFAPRYLIVSLGLDTFTGDPVGGFNLTTAGLAEIGHRIVGLGLPTIIVQEGGYLLEKLGENAVAFLKALA